MALPVKPDAEAVITVISLLVPVAADMLPDVDLADKAVVGFTFNNDTTAPSKSGLPSPDFNVMVAFESR